MVIPTATQLPTVMLDGGRAESSATTARAPVSSVLELVGNTPLVRLDKLAQQHGIKCNVYAKLECLSAGGSIKDRIALRMVEEAERNGTLIPGKSVLVEPSSGNTGIGLALVAAVKGYRCIITMPEKMSIEKENTMRALGAEIIRTPTEAAHDSPDSNIGRAKTLLQEIPHAVMLNQYDNPANPDAHYYTTAPEIIESIALTRQRSDSDRPSTGLVDVLVAGSGTGGTITGMARRLKEHNPDSYIVGVDPRGSILARPESLNTLEKGESAMYKVEGIGYDFIPGVLKHDNVDYWIKSNDETSFQAARELIKLEGVLCGGSSGAAIHAAVEFLKSAHGWEKFGSRPEANVVVLLADGIRNYVTSNWLSGQH
ncbi:cystathionine beta-synthase [Microbotryomycetes sp. JL201]|nr:cystathionine beta-synthase [Microbotryomycetes sp. JL201]